MKGMLIALAVFCVSLAASAQTKMYITKTNGIDSLLLSDIKSIGFKSPAIADTTLQSQLVAYYPFNGNACDSSGKGNDGINNGAILTADRFGRSNNAYQFNGNSSISIPEVFPDSCNAFTITAWVKCNTKDLNDHEVVYKGTLRGEASIGITNGKLAFGVNLHVVGTPVSTQNWYAADTPDTLKANNYYFLVGRYIKGQKAELFINGSIVSFVAIPNLKLCSNPGGTPSAIGTHGHPAIAPTYYWNGVIDDVRIYSLALSDGEILSLYHERGWQGN